MISMDINILENILCRTVSGKDYKNFCLVSRAWYTTINKLFPSGDKFCNHLLTLLMKFPNSSLVDDSPTNEHWNYSSLSYNSSITANYIKANIDKPWDFHGLSENTAINSELVDEYPDKPWDYGELCNNPSISLDFLLRNYDRNDIKRHISYNPNITWEIVQNNPNIEWSYDGLSCNSNITWEIVSNNSGYWDFERMMQFNPNITWEIIQELPIYLRDFCTANPNVMLNIEDYEHLVDYRVLSQNFAITEEYVLKHLDKHWDYSALSYRLQKITWKLLSVTLDKPWDYQALSCKISLSLEEFKKVMDKPWIFTYLSRCVSWDYILEFSKEPSIDVQWDYRSMTLNYNIPLSIIFDNLDKPWDLYYLSFREDLTWREVVNHPEIKWNFKSMSGNEFKGAPIQF